MNFSLPLPDNIKRLILARQSSQIIFGIVLLGLVLAVSVFQWQQAKIKKMRHNIGIEEERITVGSEVAELDKKIAQMSSLYARKPTSLSLKKIEQIASDNKMTIISASQDSESDSGLYTVNSFKLALEAGYHNLGKFISALESYGDMVQIGHLYIKNKGGGVPLSGTEDPNNLAVNIEATVAFIK